MTANVLLYAALLDAVRFLVYAMISVTENHAAAVSVMIPSTINLSSAISMITSIIESRVDVGSTTAANPFVRTRGFLVRTRRLYLSTFFYFHRLV